MANSQLSRRFAIAVSFPGEHRLFVRNVVDRLAEVVGGDRVFYDEWYEAELVGNDGDLKLRRIYREDAELIVPFFSQHYDKPWCGIEWSAIRAMLLKRRKENAVVPVEMDGTRIDGWEEIDFAIRRNGRSGKVIADLILKAYQFRHPESSVGRNRDPNESTTAAAATASEPAADIIQVRWTDELSTYGEGFAGREEELKLLDEAWNGGEVRVAVFHAEGGAGKTRLLVEWLRRLRDRGWPRAGRIFVHSFYSQGNKDHSYASADLFFEQALAWFGYQGEPITDARTRGQTLARLVVEQRGLLVLDGLEPLQHAASFNEGRLRDPGIEQLLLSLSTVSGGPRQAAMCVVTSRQPIVELRDRVGRTVVQQPLDRLDRQAGAALLRQLDVRGTDDELFDAVDEYQGHAYSLMLLGTYLRDATGDHDIRRRAEIPLLDEDRQHGSHADQLFGAYVLHLGQDSPEVTLLRLLGLFDRAAQRELIDVLCEPRDDALDDLTASLRQLSPGDWNRLYRRLVKLRLIVLVDDPPAIDSHPLLREYFGAKLRLHEEAAFRAAHGRLFDHLCGTTEHQPDTLAGLQPLYQAVTHGCLAGRQQEACDKVYFDRILRGGDFFSWKKLGAIGADLGAVAAFFDSPWRRLSPNLSEADQAWLLNEAAFFLRALGRLTEAREPMRVSLEMCGIGASRWHNVDGRREPMRVSLEMCGAREVWKQAAGIASNLSELEATLGLLGEVVDDGRRAIELADRSGDAFWKMVTRTTAADALHQRGERGEARALFEEAERMQADDEPQFPLLYSLPGFRYADLILAPAERAAWRRVLNRLTAGPAGRASSETPSPSGLRLNEDERTEALAACAEATRRASQTFEWANSVPNASLLDIALDHLTLARAGLYRAILESAVPAASALQSPASALHLALNGLRQAGQLEFVAKGLLTASLLERMKDEGGRMKSEQHLAEAQLIAERGPMPLYLADVHLHRARLFAGRTDERGRRYDSAADLATARQLIARHRYGRRNEELADAEASLKHASAAK